MWKVWHQKTLIGKQLSNGIFTSNKYNITLRDTYCIWL